MDYSAFTSPVSDSDVAAYKAQAKIAGSPSYNGVSAVVAGVLMGILLGGIAVLIVTVNTIPAIVKLSTEGFTPYTVLSLFTFLFAVAVIALLVWVIRLVVAGGRSWENWLRLTRFAAANGLKFSAKDPDPTYPGIIFTRGRSRFALDHVRSIDGRFFDVGNFQYSEGSGRSRRISNWGFLAVKLDRRLPHMVLDATSNNNLFGSNLPQLFRTDQVLRLEGDFDKHFTLYCPKEYERDALYVFTPDLMAVLVDSAAPFDIEIVDDWLFAYSSKPLSVQNPSAWQTLFNVIRTVGHKTVEQTDRYADERVGDRASNIVAPQGTRLRTRISILAVIAVVVWGGIQIARLVLG